MDAVKGRWYLALVDGHKRVVKAIEVNTLKRNTETVGGIVYDRGTVRTDDEIVLFIDEHGSTGRVHQSAILRRVRARAIEVKT